MKRIIMLVDMDAFFTSCEEVRNPKLKGHPAAVGADPKQGHGRGVVATANYEARKFGLHSAMPISIAYRKCPQCIFLPVDYEYYVEVSNRVMAILKKYADKLEQVSIDEAYLDVSSKSLEEAKETARKINLEILQKEKITCSIGIGPNKLIAKMAASRNKPNGLTIVMQSGIQKMLDPLDVDELYGIGPKTAEVLRNVGINTIKQLREAPLHKLNEYFGESWAKYMHQASEGIDETPVSEEAWVPKSIGRHFTFEHDTKDRELIYATMDDMLEDAFSQMKLSGFKSYRTITIMVRYEDFETHTKAHSMIAAATSSTEGKNVARTLLQEFLRDKRKIRLIGISLSRLK